MKYLFWNTHKNENINPILCDLVVENQISIVVLAEYTAAISNLIDLLHVHGVSMQQYLTTGCERIHIIGSTGLQIKPHLQTDRSSIQVIDEKTVLCCVHLNSQLYSDSSERREIDIQQVIDDILQIEKKLNTKDTIIVGDFNLNPYDSSCVSARYFHGIPIYLESIRESRTIAGKEFYMFYNPMWNFLGDFKEPYGTYYHHSANTIETYWNIFDQVIIRPALRKRFVDNSLQILTETSTISLLDGNKHPNHDISDHLPITFEIEEDNHE